MPQAIPPDVAIHFYVGDQQPSQGATLAACSALLVHEPDITFVPVHRQAVERMMAEAEKGELLHVRAQQRDDGLYDLVFTKPDA